jgi:hypothetical protein
MLPARLEVTDVWQTLVLFLSPPSSIKVPFTLECVKSNWRKTMDAGEKNDG